MANTRATCRQAADTTYHRLLSLAAQQEPGLTLLGGKEKKKKRGEWSQDHQKIPYKKLYFKWAQMSKQLLWFCQSAEHWNSSNMPSLFDYQNIITESVNAKLMKSILCITINYTEYKLVQIQDTSNT